MRDALRQHRATWRLAVGAAAAGLAVAAGAVALAGPWDAGQRSAERRQAAADATGDRMDTERIGSTLPAAEPVLVPLEAGEGGAEGAGVPAGLTDALGSLLGDPALGDHVTAAVLDLTTGERLYAEDPGGGRVPASTIKIVTALAALDALGPDHRLATTVRWDADGERVVLVGGGDPTLTEADLAGLARRTAAALAERGITGASLAYDVSLYAGGGQRHPLGVNDNIALITPLQVNEGRLDGSTSGPTPRATHPEQDAAELFAADLAEAGLRVEGRPARHAAPEDPEEAEQLAIHRSAPLGSLVERMLTNSDNDLAEALGRHTALAQGRRADFRGVGRAVAQELDALGLPHEGVRIADASGLDREDRLTADLLTRALVAAGDPDRPELRPVLTGLPVAGFTGTLAGRFDGDAGAARDTDPVAGGAAAAPADAGAGAVRAKTGTLTGVNTLAGTVMTRDGRVLAFAFLASGTADAAAAEAALDAAAGTLAGCACG
ncbi:D-alanyl-D-alanine carboxypeptidase/D-alanyl-D-alanine-endopeptidase [Streptomyces hoynatensis]|uniref:D-alanyl-D-alanine carboxypeptidase/D-alanyl-D-alanine-endopeptidase n=1 Tax=Streptomyces hoynatensis TaxID=1141874 RepID=A0A3A9Z5W7_9ACTN|nr:D-alanyl-D-alanine carboxypeptidase/D-alanyl-D-alanine-endopeptidase [Streptomyces hoynatensis]